LKETIKTPLSFFFPLAVKIFWWWPTYV